MMLTDTEIYYATLRRWVERYERVLDQLPILLETLRSSIPSIPSDSRRYGGERVSSSGDGAPAPLRLDPVDDCDDLWSALVEYVGEVAERLQDPTPGATGASWAVNGSVRGIPSHLDPDGAYKAAFELIAWLIDRAEKIHALGLKDSEDHLFTLIRKLMSRYVIPPVERPSHRRPCSVCGERAVLVDWVLGESGEASCRVCGATYERERLGTE